jgi:putative DNA-invertase from lambdoid prophage Rac
MGNERIVAAYVRVSSASQDHGMQRDAIERCAKSRGHRIGRWFSEKVSVTKRGQPRPALDEVRELSRLGGIEALYVYRIDRLTRTGVRDTLHVIEELSLHGTKVLTVADGFDLTGPAAEIVLAVLAWAAKMEGQAISERISAARARIVAEGGNWGRPKRMAREEIAKAKGLQQAGRTLREIAATLKVPRATVARALSQKGTYGKDGKQPVVRQPVARASR